MTVGNRTGGSVHIIRASAFIFSLFFFSVCTTRHRHERKYTHSIYVSAQKDKYHTQTHTESRKGHYVNARKGEIRRCCCKRKKNKIGKSSALLRIFLSFLLLLPLPWLVWDVCQAEPMQLRQKRKSKVLLFFFLPTFTSMQSQSPSLIYGWQ